MRELIHPIGGFETAILGWPRQSPATPVQISMEGWLWYVILYADVTIDNSLGAVVANAHIFTTYTQLNPMRAMSGIAAGVGAIQETLFGVGSASFTGGAGNPNTTSLPLVVNPNAANLTVAWIGGDAATRVNTGWVSIIGLKRNTMKNQ